MNKYQAVIDQLKAELGKEKKTREINLALAALQQFEHWIQCEFLSYEQLQQQFIKTNQILWIALKRLGGDIEITEAELLEVDNPQNSIIQEVHPEQKTITLKSDSKN